jgi:CheY-like chemotaxis protein
LEPKIIYVEDSAEDAELFKETLDRFGLKAEVVILEDSEALDYFDQIAAEGSFTPDVIVLDLKMPEQNGITLLKAIKEIPHFDTTPVVIFSGAMGPSEKSDALRNGASLCLEKARTPEDWDDIISGISSFLVS